MKTSFITFLWLMFAGICSGQNTSAIYRCTPCRLSCDSISFQHKGVCPQCQMRLITEAELYQREHLQLNAVNIDKGSGLFLIEGGIGQSEKSIRVYYHQPQNYTPDSPILLVIPGSGRDADEYRDAWIEASEKWGVLILSPMYSEEDYDFGAYHLGGLLYEMNTKQSVRFRENSNIVELDEKKLNFKINFRAEEWIFRDFDRLFDAVVKATGSAQTRYDVFGHSAGGQILHRLALFHPSSKANRIIAANSGFYTMPDFNIALPFGLKNSPMQEQDLESSFKNRLVLFLGELDKRKRAD